MQSLLDAMAPFPPWTNSLVRTGLLLAGGLALGVPLLLLAWVRTPFNTGEQEEVVQPLMFDHRHHVIDDAIDCRYCHFGAETSRYAGVPPVAVCMSCHSQIWSDAALLEPVRRAYFDEQTLAWPRVTSVPDYVYFHHAAHVRRGVGCVSCHGRVDQMANVRKVEAMNMAFCLGCHRAPEAHLRPPERITEMAWAPPDAKAMGKAVARGLDIRPTTDCSGCHR